MRNRFGIAFLVALGALLLIGILVTPVGALLGGLVLFSAAAIALLASHVLFVRQRTTLITRSRQHGTVLRIVPGPATVLLMPLREEVEQVIDTTCRLEQVHVRDILQADLQPAILPFTAHVLYKPAPHLLSPQQLGEVLPDLTGNLSAAIQRWTDYYLRALVADTDLTHRPNSGRARLERRLERLLAERLARIGVAIQGVQLLVWPPVGLEDTLTAARQQRVHHDLQAERLAAILQALAGQSEEARSLARLEFARALGQNGQAGVGFNLASLLSAAGLEIEKAPPQFVQPPLWPEPLYSPHRR